MATTTNADTYPNSVPSGIPDNADVTVGFSYVTGAAFAPTINSLLYLAKIPKGACITDFCLWVPDLDSGTALTLDLGLVNLNAANAGFVGATAATSNAAVFLAASTIGQAGGLATAFNNPNGIVSGCVQSAAILADDILALKWHAAPTGAGAGGTLKGWVRYFCHTSGVW